MGLRVASCGRGLVGGIRGAAYLERWWVGVWECLVVEIMMCWLDEGFDWDWGREGWCL